MAHSAAAAAGVLRPRLLLLLLGALGHQRSLRAEAGYWPNQRGLGGGWRKRCSCPRSDPLLAGKKGRRLSPRPRWLHHLFLNYLFILCRKSLTLQESLVYRGGVCFRRVGLDSVASCRGQEAAVAGGSCLDCKAWLASSSPPPPVASFRGSSGLWFGGTTDGSEAQRLSFILWGQLSSPSPVLREPSLIGRFGLAVGGTQAPLGVLQLTRQEVEEEGSHVYLRWVGRGGVFVALQTMA